MDIPILRAYACYQCAKVVWLDLDVGTVEDRLTVGVVQDGHILPRHRGVEAPQDEAKEPMRPRVYFGAYCSIERCGKIHAVNSFSAYWHEPHA